ncbi:hypothetical protein [Micromonospora phaseoli]|nr:hypothetical protein [Micromonospora phaseoli]
MKRRLALAAAGLTTIALAAPPATSMAAPTTPTATPDQVVLVPAV